MCALSASIAHADKTAVLATQLRTADQYKIRLSAALSLAKSRDSRAISAMIFALIRDPQTTVRRVAALSLGKMLDDTASKAQRDGAIGALNAAAKRDKDTKVREIATRALKQLAPLANRDARTARVFIHIGIPNDPTHIAPDGTTGNMRRTLGKMLRMQAPDYAQSWPTGKLPTSKQLQANGTDGFFVGATISRLTVTRTGGRADIKCGVSVRINPWHGVDGSEKLIANQSAAARGNGKVVATNRQTSIAAAKGECLIAVTEQVTERQVIPFLRRLVAQR